MSKPKVRRLRKPCLVHNEKHEVRVLCCFDDCPLDAKSRGACESHRYDYFKKELDPKQCAVCRRWFTPDITPRQILCGNEKCEKRNLAEWHSRERERKMAERGPLPDIIRQCEICRRDVTIAKSKGVGHGSRRKYCDDCYDEGKRRKRGTPQRPESMPCHWCGTPFKPRSIRSLYCRDPECYRLGSQARRFGIPPAELKRHLDRAAGKCENVGCDRPANGRNGTPHLDHDESEPDPVKAVRGFLCYLCNKIAGEAHDDPKVLLGLVEYLENPPGRSET